MHHAGNIQAIFHILLRSHKLSVKIGWQRRHHSWRGQSWIRRYGRGRIWRVARI